MLSTRTKKFISLTIFFLLLIFLVGLLINIFCQNDNYFLKFKIFIVTLTKYLFFSWCSYLQKMHLGFVERKN